MNSLISTRIETLDWLRGLMALSIMFYHLTLWIIFPLDSSSLLGRLGVYGVSMFFVLSGLCIAIVYNHYIISIRTSINFFIRRIFKIWPLFWIVVILAIIPQLHNNVTFSYKLLFVNFTTLFGFVKPIAYIPTGAWSIGNEMVYYALTPLILILFKFRRWVGNLFFAFCLFIGLFFSFNLLNPDISLSDQWAIYVNPFNNLFLYVMGIAIYYNFRDVRFNPRLVHILLIIAIFSFSFLPYKGDLISVASGFGRVVFVLLSFTIVLCFYKSKIPLPIRLQNCLNAFCNTTYGIYLFHPIIYCYLKIILQRIHLKNDILLFSLVSILTVVISMFSYKLFEIRLINIGKKITAV